MENSSSNPLRDRDLFYFRQRMKNRVFGKLVEFFAEEADRIGLTKGLVSKLLKRDPAQVSRWLGSPSNLTLETISDLLLAAGAESDFTIVRFSEKKQPNYAHPIIARIQHAAAIPKPHNIQMAVSVLPARGYSIKATISALPDPAAPPAVSNLEIKVSNTEATHSGSGKMMVHS